MDYFIKATNEEALWTSLVSAGLAEKQYDPNDPLNVKPSDLGTDQEWLPTGSFSFVPKCQLDVIGVIYKPTGEMTTQGDFELPVMEALDGFHANLRGNLTEEQEAALPLIAKPNNQVRVWAGD